MMFSVLFETVGPEGDGLGEGDGEGDADAEALGEGDAEAEGLGEADAVVSGLDGLTPTSLPQDVQITNAKDDAKSA